MSGPVVAVILAAGRGTRMRSRTPKLLHPLCGRAMIEWPVAAAREAGADRVVVVDSPERPLGALLGDWVEIAVQGQARGTADAVKAAASHFGAGDTVLVLAGDVPLVGAGMLRDLAAAHGDSGAGATIATALLDNPTGYGRVVRGPDGTVHRVVETKAAGDATDAELQIREVNTGIFAFDGGALLDALEHVRADNAQGEYYLPDVLPALHGLGRTVAAFEVDDPGVMLGINDRVALAAVRAVAQQRINEGHMLAGVTLVDPRSTVIDACVQIGEDTVIAPFTSLHGSTVIGERCEIGPLSTVIDSRIDDGARVIHSYLTAATVGERASVGPFAYLRPGAELRAGSKAGTFVEIKNSIVGAGSKVPHLSYIGDAEIGEGSNLGAATITANYDGTHKHRTRIGDGVKTGVDTTLVAPVTIGDGAFTAAGSVIGQDVPAGALGGSPGVARKAQRNVDGYTGRRSAGEAQADLGQATGPAEEAHGDQAKGPGEEGFAPQTPQAGVE